ncbi:hypothetical protein [Methylobacterium ajmalii]
MWVTRTTDVLQAIGLGTLLAAVGYGALKGYQLYRWVRGRI